MRWLAIAAVLAGPAGAQELSVRQTNCPAFLAAVLQNIEGEAIDYDMTDAEESAAFVRRAVITAYLEGAYLAFGPEETFDAFRKRFVTTCLDHPEFPPTQIVAFYMRHGD